MKAAVPLALFVVLASSLGGCSSGSDAPPAAEPPVAVASVLAADDYGVVPVRSIGGFVNTLGLVVRAEKVPDLEALDVAERFSASVYRIDCPDPVRITGGIMDLSAADTPCRLFIMNGQSSTLNWVTAGTLRFSEISDRVVSGSFDVTWGERMSGVEPAVVPGPVYRYAASFVAERDRYRPLP